jgi:hypothetical protein
MTTTPQLRPARRIAAGVATAAALGVGALGFSALAPTGLAGAQSTDDPAAPAEGHRSRVLASVLEDLVADGTLTRAQADAVRDGVKAEAGDRLGRLHRLLAGAAETAADTIGITTDELKAAVKDGQSIGQVAEANGVEPATVVDAVTAEANAAIDAKLAAGEIDEDQAERARARVPVAAQRFVDHVRRS